MALMTAADFVKKVDEMKGAPLDVGEIDALCWRWLEEVMLDYGENGETGRKLLGIAKELIS